MYLAKDARLRPELLPAMYPQLDELREVSAHARPSGVLKSDLARRDLESHRAPARGSEGRN